jgi:hypothetical protein
MYWRKPDRNLRMKRTAKNANAWHPPGACRITRWTSNQSPAAFSEIREYFKLRGEISALRLRRRFEFATQRLLSNSKSAALAGFFAAMA